MLSFEDQNVEFKQEYVTDIRKEVIAFANAEGGTVYVGIRKDGIPIGVEDPDEVMLKIANSLKDSIAPDIMPFVSIKNIFIENVSVIEISVSTGTNRPYYIREKGLKPSGVYVRKGSSSQPMTDEGIREMIRQTSGTSYEAGRSLNQNLTFQTLQDEMSRRNIEFGVPQMHTLHLIGSDDLYTNLAYLLSDQCESMIKIARFRGIDKEIFQDRKEYTGSILKQMEDAYQYIDMTNKTSATFSGLERTDTRDYPTEALREALLNSICHRDYSYSGSNIINIYDDRIEFVSVGGLLAGYSLDSIFLGISAPRNPHLSQIFFRMNLIESYGTGIGKIQRSYKNIDKQPIFETAPGVFRVTLPNINEAAEQMTTQKLVQTPAVQSNNVTHSKYAALKNEKSLIIDYVAENGEITRQDVEEMLGIGTTKAFRLIKELCQEKKLKSQGNGRNIKYIPR